MSFTKILTDEAVSGWKFEIHVSFVYEGTLSFMLFSYGFMFAKYYCDVLNNKNDASLKEELL